MRLLYYFLIFILLLLLYNLKGVDTEIEEIRAPEIAISIPEARLPVIKEKFSQVAVLAYIQSNNIEFVTALNSHFTNRLQEAIDSPQEDRHRAVGLLNKIILPDYQDDETRAWKELHKMIVDATQEVYMDQNKEIEVIKRKMSKRWTKKRVAIITGVFTLAGAIISGVSSYFTSRAEC